MNAVGQSSTGRPFYCTRCGSLYPEPAALIACLARHEDHDRVLREHRNGWLAGPVPR